MVKTVVVKEHNEVFLFGIGRKIRALFPAETITCCTLTSTRTCLRLGSASLPRI